MENGSVFLLINIVSAAIVCNGGVLIVGEALQPGLSLLGEKHTGAGADEGFLEG